MTRKVEAIIATTQYHVVQILRSLYLSNNASYRVARKGGMASVRNPIGSFSTRFEKYAIITILNPVANAIWICGDLKKFLILSICVTPFN